MANPWAYQPCRCRELTGGVCFVCEQQPVPARAVTLTVSVPIEAAIAELVEVILEFAKHEAGPVRERLLQIAEAVSGTR